MATELKEHDMACRGAGTRPTKGMGCVDMEECVACETAVRWDLTDHPFYGFQACEHAKPTPTPEAK